MRFKLSAIYTSSCWFIVDAAQYLRVIVFKEHNSENLVKCCVVDLIWRMQFVLCNWSRHPMIRRGVSLDEWDIGPAIFQVIFRTVRNKIFKNVWKKVKKKNFESTRYLIRHLRKLYKGEIRKQNNYAKLSRGVSQVNSLNSPLPAPLYTAREEGRVRKLDSITVVCTFV